MAAANRSQPIEPAERLVSLFVQTLDGLQVVNRPALPKLNSASGWGNDLDSWEIASIPGGIVREQGKAADGCVRSDVEIG